jgi:acetate kinase
MTNSLVLVINCGSSSLKFALYSTTNELELEAEGLAESLNQPQGSLNIKREGQKEKYSLEFDHAKGSSHAKDSSHAFALSSILDKLEEQYSLKQNLIAVGHRVVHGGKIFSKSVLITSEVLTQIKTCIPLAPLHNPANVTGIESLQTLFPQTPQVAVFDTAFHQTMPEHAYTYALPYDLYKEHGVRRYGFHGTSHRYITKLTASTLSKAIDNTNIVTAHLGNGASVAAIKNGESVDTSMGMTPLEGLVMGTRSGDIDPGIFDFLINTNHSPEEISTMLNKQSGLLGISQQSNDMRTICEQAEAGDKQCQLALEVFCFRAAKHISGMMTSLETIDALIFTGGIGENAAKVRELIVKHLSIFGFSIDSEANENSSSRSSNFDGYSIHTQASTPILVIPTDEEAMIVEDTLNITADVAPNR